MRKFGIILASIMLVMTLGVLAGCGTTTPTSDQTSLLETEHMYQVFFTKSLGDVETITHSDKYYDSMELGSLLMELQMVAPDADLMFETQADISNLTEAFGLVNKGDKQWNMYLNEKKTVYDVNNPPTITPFDSLDFRYE